MSILRGVRKNIRYSPLSSESGVRIKRAFGFFHVPKFDPFLQLDEIHPEIQQENMAVFPWRPHRGIEIINYLIEGQCSFSDKSGSRIKMKPGGLSRIRCGAGAIQREFEIPKDSQVHGFQLWLNMAAANKMCEPFSEEFTAAKIRSVKLENGTEIKVLAGGFQNQAGPLNVPDVGLDLLDISIPANTRLRHRISPGKNVFAYVYSGAAEFFEDEDETLAASGHTLLFKNGNTVFLESGGNGVKMLLAAAIPLREPVAWSGPIVMTNDTELRRAFREYEEGKFRENKEKKKEQKKETKKNPKTEKE